MKIVIQPSEKFIRGFCNWCDTDCKNDCGKQTGCSELVKQKIEL